MDRCNCQIHISFISSCKTIEVNNSLHSPACSSSHANDLLLQFHTSHAKPYENIYATITNLFSNNSYDLLNSSLSKPPSNQGSLKNMVEHPSPTTRPINTTPPWIKLNSFNKMSILPLCNIIPPPINFVSIYYKYR